MSDTIHARFAAAYAAIANPHKDAANPAFRSRYATLGAYLDEVRPVLTANKLTLCQPPVSDEGGVGVRTLIYDEAGEVLDFGSFTVPLDKHNAQGAGSAITYCRRYALGAVFGLDAEDDDGNAASAPPKPKPDKTAEAKKRLWAKAQSVNLSLEGLEKLAGKPLDKLTAPECDKLTATLDDAVAF